MLKEYESTALLALPKIKEDTPPSAGLLSWSRPYLIHKIRESGVDVLVSRGVDAFDADGDTVNGVVRPEYDIKPSGESHDVVIHNIGRVGLDSLRVVRNIIRPIYPETSDTPFLNPNSVRALGRNKFNMAQAVLDSNGVYGRKYVNTSATDTTHDIAEKIALLPGEIVVAKPIMGKRSNGVFIGSKHSVIEGLEQADDQDYMIEERLLFDHPLPELKASNPVEQSRLDYANGSGVNKELRLYYFGDNVWDGVVRVAKAGETKFIDDEWLYIDQDSIPGSLIEKSSSVVSTIRRLVTARDHEFHIAIDWAYAKTSTNPDPDWRVMEVNAAEPQLVQLGENLEVGKRQHDKLATQISRIALR